MTLEEQIKHYRKQAGLSQEKMAEKIGVSRQAITKWENGTGTPDIANLMAIADLFQISVDELLSNEKSQKKQSDYIYESRTEYDIDGKKNFDIKLGGAYAVDLKAVSYTHLFQLLVVIRIFPSLFTFLDRAVRIVILWIGCPSTPVHSTII